MPPQVAGYPSSIWSTFLFLSIFIVAFFPNAFISLIDLPFGFTSEKYAPPSIIHANPQANVPAMAWFQKTITLPSRSRGSYLITDTIVKELPEIKQYKVGVLHLFVQHTSCALSMNENWDEDVREDMSDALDRIVPEDRKGNLYRHSAEGADDMPVTFTTRSPKFCRKLTSGLRHM
jgi:secondary thiamine-phosphate synthase enzyme